MLGKRKATAGKASKQIKRVCHVGDRPPTPDDLALATINMSVVPVEHRALLRDAMAELDLSVCKPLKTQWGETKRLQATFGTADCVIKNYNFSRLDNPILTATGTLLTLLEQAAQQLQAESNSVIMHINYYPKGTAAGCAAHQDDEECIDQAFPIVGYQVGGPATFHVWSGKPEGRSGASVIIDESQSYVMPAGFQLVNWHAVTRSKVGEKAVCRYNVTFRVVLAPSGLKDSKKT
jgi:hypothetical protein